MPATQISQQTPHASFSDKKLQVASLADEKLFELCQKYGEQARFWRQKFLGLLPEVYRRKLYEKKGFSSIFEFAKKLAGVSEEQIRLVLNLDKKFDDKPLLKSLLESGAVSVNKLARVSSIANSENQDFLASQVRLLPKSALDTLVRDHKNIQNSVNGSEGQNGLFKGIFQQKSLPGQMFLKQNPNDTRSDELLLSQEVKQKLLELQNKGIDINQLLLGFLEKRDLEIAQEKEKLAAEIHSHAGQERKISRYIPRKIKKLLQKEYGTKCSIPQCRKEAEEIHHTQRFALGKTHDPRFLAPLCKEHHVIAHSIDEKFREKRVAISSVFAYANRSSSETRSRSGGEAALQTGRR